MKVKKISKCKTERVYDISVNKHQNYVLENGVITHNSGLKYAASTIVYLSKKKDKDGSEVVGNIIHCKTYKSRLTKENQMVDVRLSYTKGLDKYYGLLELGEKHGVFSKVSTRYELPDGSKIFGKQMLEDPEKYFTDDVMKKLDEAAKTEISYGKLYTRL